MLFCVIIGLVFNIVGSIDSSILQVFYLFIVPSIEHHLKPICPRIFSLPTNNWTLVLTSCKLLLGYFQ